MSFAFRESPRSVSSLPPNREPRVLIVDESPWRRLAIANLLEAEGYQLLDVSPRDDVLAAVASFEPDLILLDEAAADASEGTLSTQLARSTARATCRSFCSRVRRSTKRPRPARCSPVSTTTFARSNGQRAARAPQCPSTQQAEP